MRHLPFSLLAGVVVLAASACDDPLSLQPATDANFIDTVVVFALRGTPIDEPSGYDVVLRETARTDRADPFDFAFDIEPDGTPLIYPRGALGLSGRAGVVLVDEPFADIDEAPTDDYESDVALEVGTDAVFVVRSRAEQRGLIPCPVFIGPLPRYGKFRVLAIDPQARSVTLEALVNVNCGYRGLEPGIPER